MEFQIEEIGRRISARRRQMNIKQNVLAERVGLSNNYLSGIERGKECPTLAVFIRICNELKVTPDYLIMGSMHLNGAPQNLTDNYRLCSEEDQKLLISISELFVERNSKKWNKDHFM